MAVYNFDHIIVGTGQATGTLIGGLPKSETLAIIEGGKIGGTCVNVGCTPTKTLVASAKVVYVAKRAAEYGVVTGNVQVDFAKVMARMNKVRMDGSSGMEGWLNSLEQVTLFRGWAKFEDAKTLRVNDELIKGKNIYLNVGGRSRTLPILGLDEVDWLDSSGLLDLTEVPEHLVIIGGSYIGLEFGQMFRRFGAKVTIIEASSQIMSREDADVTEAAQQILEDEDISFEIGVKVLRVEKTATSDVNVVIEGEQGEKVISGSHLLLAVGRVPNSDKLNLETTGIETNERGFIKVDDHLRTNVEGVFALGDVNGKGAFTHTSVNDAEIVLDTMRGGTRKLSDRISIYAMFIDPPLGRVGMTEKEAIEKGYNVLKATREMKRISRAKEMGETKGFVKLLVDGDTDLILGGSILGVGGDEIINMFAAFMYSKLPCRNYRKVILVHSTVSELMPWILDDLKPVS